MSKVMKKSATAYGMNGRVGNIVYYQNGGDTNAMIYDDAPRKNKSINQVTNQCKWTNIVQLWRSSSEFLCRCFQHKKGRIEAHVCICFIAYKVYKELERLIAVNKIGMSVDKVLDAARTITTIRAKMPENGTYFTKTLFLTEKHLAIRPLFDLYSGES